MITDSDAVILDSEYKDASKGLYRAAYRLISVIVVILIALTMLVSDGVKSTQKQQGFICAGGLRCIPVLCDIDHTSFVRRRLECD